MKCSFFRRTFQKVAVSMWKNSTPLLFSLMKGLMESLDKWEGKSNLGFLFTFMELI